MREQRVTLPSADPSIELEGRLHLPASPAPAPGVVVCHPYPPGGGSLLVKVVRAVARTLAEHGFAALRFNFRGVGLSGGAFDHGRGEVDDLAGAVRWLAARDGVDGERLGLAGYSFGAMMVTRYEERVGDLHPLVLIGPPLDWGIALPERASPPWLVIAGDRDPFCPLEALRPLLRRASTLRVIDDADHFLIGREAEVAAVAVSFLTAALTPAAGD